MIEAISTARYREIGAELRRIRKDAGFQAQQLSTMLGWQPSTLSRIETGKRSVSDVEVATFVASCGVVGAELNRLVELSREPDIGYRVKPHRGQVSDELKTLIFHEETAKLIHSYEPIYIPGLTQTAEYARALFWESGAEDIDVVDLWVTARIRRQRLLRRHDGPQVFFYVHENALRTPVGSHRIMQEQMLNLLFLGTQSNVAVRVVPTSAGGRGLASGTFRLFRYADSGPVVGLQHETATEFLERPSDIAAFEKTLDRVATVALTDVQSREFLADLASDYERRGDGDDGGQPDWRALAEE